MVPRLVTNDRYNSRDNNIDSMAKLKDGWWCIHEECRYYCTPDRCGHNSIKKELNKNELKVSKLRMCPVFTSLEACLLHVKIDARED